MQVPETLAATLDEATLRALDGALGPPAARRMKGRFELEVEAKGEGTFTLSYVDGKVSAKKGFAKGDPLVSAEIPAGGFRLVRRILTDASSSFAKAPELARRHKAALAVDPSEWQRMVAALEAAGDIAVVIDLRGAGRYRVARGALDEATRQLTVSAEASLVERVLDGGDVTAVSGVKLSGDRGVAADLLRIFGPLASALKR